MVTCKKKHKKMNRIMNNTMKKTRISHFTLFFAAGLRPHRTTPLQNTRL